MNNITRDEISEFINNEFGLSKKDCTDIINEIIEQIITGLISQEWSKKLKTNKIKDQDKNQNSNNLYEFFKIFKIHNFGTFKIKQKNARIGRNPITREDVMISPRNVISFIPSKKILSIINDKS